MDNRDKTIKLLKSFLSTKEVEGICGYIVDPDGEGTIQVIIVLDIDFINNANTKPGFIAKMFREGVRQEIKKWLGLDVYVGSMAKKCDEPESLSESISIYVKRRLNDDEMLDELNYLLDYQINLSAFNNLGECISEICEILNNNFIDYIQNETNVKLSFKEKDSLYFYFVEKCKDYITKKYIKNKRVTESQYRLLKEDEQKILQLPSIDYFGGWKGLQKYLKRKGNPLYSISGDLDLRDTSIESLGNLTSVGGNLN